MRTKIIFLIFTVLALSYINIYAQTKIYVNPSSYYASIGDTIKVIVKIDNVNSLHSSSVTVRFNNSIVKFLSASNAGSIFNGNWIDNQPLKNYVYDSVIVDQALMGFGVSVSGSDTLFSLRFKALANGISPVILESPDLRDPNNGQIVSTLDSGHIFIGGISINVKIFLQGPFSSSTHLMSTSLNSLNYLPLEQPYNVSPWYYNGIERVSSDFFASETNIVDWVLIELRKNTSGSSVFRTKAALIKNDGTIVDYIDGVSPVFIVDTTAGSYYIVIRHRNHISVMSAAPVPLTNISSVYDFTTNTSTFYGGDAMLLSSGIYGMYAGDANGNGIINAADRNLVIINTGYSGYFGFDLNLNGINNAADRNIVIQNTGRATYVPN